MTRITQGDCVRDMFVGLGNGRELYVLQALVYSVEFGELERSGWVQMDVKFLIDTRDVADRADDGHPVRRAGMLMEVLMGELFTVPVGLRTETVRGLAEAILSGPRLDLMPILADALEENGLDPSSPILKVLRLYNEEGKFKSAYLLVHHTILESCRATL